MARTRPAATRSALAAAVAVTLLWPILGEERPASAVGQHDGRAGGVIQRTLARAQAGDALGAARAATSVTEDAFARAVGRGSARHFPMAVRRSTLEVASPTVQLPELAAVGAPMRPSLRRLLEAFGHFESAAASLGGGGTDVAVAMAGVGAARQALLAAVLNLEDTAGTRPSGSTPAAVQTPCLDLVGTDSRYSADCAILVDVGGNDTYSNNAGGVNGGAAALVDLGGNDTYAVTRNSGVNGGAVAGAGFLYDAAGDDTYSAGSNGINGGGYFFGAGFLLDAGGNDRYGATQTGTNGGSSSLASGLLLDLGAGSDSYTGTRGGVNGGSAGGAGLLVDAGGTDSYSDQEACTGSGVDRTVVPTGTVGAQLDATNPRGSACLPALPPLPSTAFGSIEGRVTETRTGAGIVGARVECGGAGTGVAMVDGRYSVPLARAGTHTCTASAVGFRSKSVDVAVSEGTTTTVNFTLRRT